MAFSFSQKGLSLPVLSALFTLNRERRLRVKEEQALVVSA
jgi:hypothetical protein